MQVIPDFSSFDAAASRLDQHADELRSRAAMLAALVAGIEWASIAATAFRHRGDLVCRQLLGCATGLEHAAYTLRGHAATARQLAPGLGALSLLGGVNPVAELSQLALGADLVTDAWNAVSW